MKKSILIFLVIITVIFIVSCPMPARDNPADKKSPNYQVGIVELSPADESILTGNQDIVIQFSDSMTPSAPSIGGTLSGAGYAWSTTEETNDTLTLSISPGLWPEGDGQTLTVDGSSAEGNAVSETFGFDVFYGVFVSSPVNVENPGDDGIETPGTMANPFATIQHGITIADGLYTTGEVRVAEGLYQGTSPVVTIANGISVYGGYSSNFMNRNITLYNSYIEDLSDSGGTGASPNSVVLATGTLNITQLFDGFSIIIGAGEYNAGIFCSGSGCQIYLSNNTIIGRDSVDTSALEVYGIIIRDQAAPTIYNNDIDPGFGSANSYGIKSTDSTPVISNNININGGENGGLSEFTSSYAIFCSGVYSPAIEYNSIDCGRAPTPATRIGISLSQTSLSDGGVIINNNQFYNSDLGGSVYYINEQNVNSDPASVHNNNFNTINGIYYRDENSNDVDDLVFNAELNTDDISTGEGTQTLAYWENTAE